MQNRIVALVVAVFIWLGGIATLAVGNALFTTHKVMEDGVFAVTMAELFVAIVLSVALIAIVVGMVGRRADRSPRVEPPSR